MGLGQLGTLFAEAFLRLGSPVVPLLRRAEFESVRAFAPDPDLVLLTVGEDDLSDALQSVPVAFHDRVALVQNELRPHQWRAVGLAQPTTCVVWFERKAGAAPKNLLPSGLAGPQAYLLAEALDVLELPYRMLSESELSYELCLKNLYILGLNLAGLEQPGLALDLIEGRRTDFMPLFDDLLRIEETLFQESFERASLWRDFERAVRADPGHKIVGRTAPRRLARTLEHARRTALSVPRLEALARRSAALALDSNPPQLVQPSDSRRGPP